MWAAYVAYDGARDGCIGQLFSKKTIPDDFGGLVPTTPVFVLPADPESVKGYVNILAPFFPSENYCSDKTPEELARAALAALLRTKGKDA